MSIDSELTRSVPLVRDANGNAPLPGQTVVPAAAALEYVAMEIAERQGTANTRKTYRTAFLAAIAGMSSLLIIEVSQS